MVADIGSDLPLQREAMRGFWNGFPLELHPARTQQDDFLVRPIELDALSLNVRIIPERVVNDTAVKGSHRFQFHDAPKAAALPPPTTPPPQQRLASISPITTHIDRDLR